MSEMIKNIEKEKVFKIAEAVAYEEGGVSSLTLAQKPGVGITILAFDAGEGVSMLLCYRNYSGRKRAYNK